MTIEDFGIDKIALKLVLKLLYEDNISLGTIVEDEDGNQYMIISLNTEYSHLQFVLFDICNGRTNACSISKFALYYGVKGKIELTDNSLTKLKKQGFLANHVTIMHMIKNLKDIRVGSLIENNDGTCYDLVVDELEESYTVFRLKLKEEEFNFEIIQDKIIDSFKDKGNFISHIKEFRYSRASRIVKQFCDKDIEIMMGKLKLLGYY